MLRLQPIKIVYSENFSDSGKLIPDLRAQNVKEFKIAGMTYILKNVGVGAAINFKIDFIDNTKKEVIINNSPMTLTPMQEVGIFILYHNDECIKEESSIMIEYSDIYNNEYYQKHQINFDLEKGAYEINQTIEQKRKSHKQA